MRYQFIQPQRAVNCSHLENLSLKYLETGIMKARPYRRAIQFLGEGSRLFNTPGIDTNKSVIIRAFLTRGLSAAQMFELRDHWDQLIKNDKEWTKQYSPNTYADYTCTMEFGVDMVADLLYKEPSLNHSLNTSEQQNLTLRRIMGILNLLESAMLTENLIKFPMYEVQGSRDEYEGYEWRLVMRDEFTQFFETEYFDNLDLAEKALAHIRDHHPCRFPKVFKLHRDTPTEAVRLF